MSQRASTANSTFDFTREYTTPYAALIRDDIVMGVPRYFLERWVSALGPGSATLVNTLRQIQYRTHQETITISGAALAQEAFISRRHLYTCLNTPWVNAFVRIESGQCSRSKSGQLVQQTNQYFIRMDDPLTPADAEHLFQLLSYVAEDPLSAARKALEYPSRQLWADSSTMPAEHFVTPQAITAHDVLSRAFPTWSPDTEEQKNEFAQLAETLHRHITLVREDGRTTKIILPQYFRQRWWKYLGHDLAWSYLWLRGNVFDSSDGTVRRNSCWVPSINTLLAIINRPREWWRRNVENAVASPDGWSLADFFKQSNTQKGRDPAHPQWVARQFEVALDIPVAPEDREHYTELLNRWQQNTPLIQGRDMQGLVPSATNEHTGPKEMRHKRTHPQSGQTQIDTPGSAGSATNEHTDIEGVCLNSTQRSASSLHTESKSKTKELSNPKEFTSSKQLDSAAVTVIVEGKRPQLFEQIAETAEQRPSTPLYSAAVVQAWLQQTWPEPIRPHSPAWDFVTAGHISAHQLVALILAVWADTSIKHPPRYLSWLIQRWQTLPELPPVDSWDRWLYLAELPLSQWQDQGRSLWVELASRDNRTLPFGLDAILVNSEMYAISSISAENQTLARSSVLSQQSVVDNPMAQNIASDGLDDRLGDDSLTVRDIWRATLGQLRVQLNRSTYVNWVEGTQAVAYHNGVLTVKAKHIMARDLLAQRLNYSIEKAASAMAQRALEIHYIADSPEKVSVNPLTERVRVLLEDEALQA